MSAAGYQPLNTLKPVCPDVWIVDGPEIRYGPAKMPFPTRMTLVRSAGGELFVHSPTALTPPLRAEVEALGRPRWIIGPNRLHYWWVGDWLAAFPDAEAYLAPKIPRQGGVRIDYPHRKLAGADGYPWDAEIATQPVPGRFMTEYAFLHRASRTLLLTDLIENFEPHKLPSPWLRLLTWIGGVRDPDGQTPRDLRLTFDRQAPAFQAAIRALLAWAPERVILAHGRWYAQDGAAELRRALRWTGLGAPPAP